MLLPYINIYKQHNGDLCVLVDQSRVYVLELCIFHELDVLNAVLMYV